MLQIKETLVKSVGAAARADAMLAGFYRFGVVTQWLHYKNSGAILARIDGADGPEWVIVKPPSESVS